MQITKDEVIRIAKEADLWLTSDERIEAAIRFANLVAAIVSARKLYEINKEAEKNGEEL